MTKNKSELGLFMEHTVDINYPSTKRALVPRFSLQETYEVFSTSNFEFYRIPKTVDMYVFVYLINNTLSDGDSSNDHSMYRKENIVQFNRDNTVRKSLIILVLKKSEISLI